MSLVRDRQAPLRRAYSQHPEQARTRKWAKTSSQVVPPTDPLHGEVEIGHGFGTSLHIGIDHAVGGFHDGPNPGDLLCAALASCTDSTIRMAAEANGVRIQHLEVEVTSDYDARGALGVDRNVRIGLQALDCTIHLQPAPDTDPNMIEKVLAAGERYCVVLDTLRHGVEVRVDTESALAVPTAGPSRQRAR